MKVGNHKRSVSGFKRPSGLKKLSGIPKKPALVVRDEAGNDVSPLPLLRLDQKPPNPGNTIARRASNQDISGRPGVSTTTNTTTVNEVTVGGVGAGYQTNSLPNYLTEGHVCGQMTSLTMQNPTGQSSYRGQDYLRGNSLNMPADISSQTSESSLGGRMGVDTGVDPSTAQKMASHQSAVQSMSSDMSAVGHFNVHGTALSSMMGGVVSGALYTGAASGAAMSHHAFMSGHVTRGGGNKSGSSNEDPKASRPPESLEGEEFVYTEPPNYTQGFVKKQPERRRSQFFAFGHEVALNWSELEEEVEVRLEESESVVLLNISPSAVFKPTHTYPNAAVADEEDSKSLSQVSYAPSIAFTASVSQSRNPRTPLERLETKLASIRIRNAEYMEFRDKHKEKEEYPSRTVQTIVNSRKDKFVQTGRVHKVNSEAQVSEGDIYDEMLAFESELEEFFNDFGDEELRASLDFANYPGSIAEDQKFGFNGDSVIVRYCKSGLDMQTPWTKPNKLLIKPAVKGHGLGQVQGRGLRTNTRRTAESEAGDVASNLYAKKASRTSGTSTGLSASDIDLKFLRDNSNAEDKFDHILKSKELKWNLQKVERIFSWNLHKKELLKIFGPQNFDLDSENNSVERNPHSALDIIEKSLQESAMELETQGSFSKSSIVDNPVPEVSEDNGTKELSRSDGSGDQTGAKVDESRKVQVVLELKHSLTEGTIVNCIDKCKGSPFIFAAAYGYHKLNETSRGVVLCWNMKNVMNPERIYKVKDAVTSLSFAKIKHHVLGVGTLSGRILVYNVTDDDKFPILDANSTIVSQNVTKSSKSQATESSEEQQAFMGLQSGSDLTDARTMLEKHTSAIWHLLWISKQVFDGSGDKRDERLVSVGADGRVIRWKHIKGVIEQHPLTRLKKVIQPNAKGGRVYPKGGLPQKVHLPISPFTGVLCADNSHQFQDQLLMGATDGSIQRCSCSFEDKILETYSGHQAEVFKVFWSPFCSNVFLSCSADWTIRLWKEEQTEACLVINPGQKEMVRDIKWSPRKSTVFASVTASTLSVYDLAQDIVDPVASYTLEESSHLSLDKVDSEYAREDSNPEDSMKDVNAQFRSLEFLTQNTILVGDNNGTVRVIWVGLESILEETEEDRKSEKLVKILSEGSDARSRKM